MISLAGKRVAVIGGGGAIGRAIGEAVAAADGCVVALDIDWAAAEQAVAALPGSGHRSGAIDVIDPTSVERACELASADGPIHALVYAAGIAFTANVVDTEPTQLRQLMAVNLDGAFFTCGAFCRQMIEKNISGSVVLISSIAGLRGEAGAAAYCASKFGLIGLAESLAAELAGQGIRVNAICPGNVDSPLLRSVARWQAERGKADEADVLAQMTHVGAAERLVEPEEVAAAVIWLASPLASAVTGTTLRVDVGALVG